MIIERLINRLPGKRSYKVGISAKDLEGFALTDDAKADIIAALNSKDLTDVRLGLFFAEQLLKPQEDCLFDKNLLQIILPLFERNEGGVRSNCLNIIIRLRDKVDNYRDLMLHALRDKDAQVRRNALLAYHSFAKPNEIEPLEPFEKDDYVTEIGMGSHLIYELRNLALETIEKITGRQFKKYEKTEVYNGKNVVFWWDWELYNKWKSSVWRKLRYR